MEVELFQGEISAVPSVILPFISFFCFSPSVGFSSREMFLFSRIRVGCRADRRLRYPTQLYLPLEETVQFCQVSDRLVLVSVSLP